MAEELRTCRNISERRTWRKLCFDEADIKQPLMSTFTDARRRSPARATQIPELIAEIVARDLRPLSVVEGERVASC